jgi:uncharacterized phage infection (PIP) family protein YhgE
MPRKVRGGEEMWPGEPQQQYRLHVPGPEEQRPQDVKNRLHVPGPEEQRPQDVKNALRHEYWQAYLRNTEAMRRKTEAMRRDHQQLCACVLMAHRSQQEWNMANQQNHCNTQEQLALQMGLNNIHRNVVNGYLHDTKQLVQEQTTQINDMQQLVQEQTTQINDMQQLVQQQTTQIKEQKTQINDMQQLVQQQTTQIKEQKTQINNLMQMMVRILGASHSS